MPGLERISRTPRQALDYLNTAALYTTANTSRLLQDSGLACPPFPTYVDQLIAYVKATYAARKKSEQAEDPLA